MLKLFAFNPPFTWHRFFYQTFKASLKSDLSLKSVSVFMKCFIKSIIRHLLIIFRLNNKWKIAVLFPYNEKKSDIWKKTSKLKNFKIMLLIFLIIYHICLKNLNVY